MFTKKLHLFFALSFTITFFISGCRTLEVEPDYSSVVELQEPEKIGIYHKVEHGETIWRIAKTYDVAIDDIIKVNNIPDAAQVEENQLIFIPGVFAAKEIASDVRETEKDFVWPVEGKVIRHFGQKYNSRLNKGIDIEVFKNEIVRASRSGQVVFADYLSGYGQTIIVDHTDGYYSVYAQNGKLLVKLGEYVVKNRDIAYVGQGDDRAYLHFEIRKNTIERNPLHFLP